MEVFENTTFSLIDADVAFLHRILRGHLERRRDGWAITRVIGHVSLPSGVVLRIRSPKASGAAVLAWMAFVDPTLSGLRVLGSVPDAADVGDVAALAARLFMRELLQVLQKHGIGRRYVATRAVSASVRGRIDFAMLTRRAGELSKLPCHVWERLPDTPLNRLLAAAVDAIACDSTLRAAVGPDFYRARATFAGVPLRVSQDMLSGKGSVLRTEEPFLPAIALARIILRGAALGEGHRSSGIGFVINLESLFERTVIRALLNAKIGIVPKAPVPYLRIESDGSRVPLGMEADAFIPRSRTGAVVIDAKFKSHLSAGNVQQIVTYCYVLGAQRGVLVVPDDAATSRYYDVTPIASSGTGFRVHVVPFATNGTTIEQWRSAAAAFVLRINAVLTA